MKNFISHLLILSLLMTFSAPVFAKKSWRLFPGTEEDFALKPTLSLMGGVLSSNDNVGDTSTAYGLEASFMCSVIQSPTNALRQQISYAHYEKNKNKLQTGEANLHYRFDITKDFKLGFGPGIGYVRTDAANVTSNMLAMQFGGSAHYSLNHFFAGAEYRYQITQRNHVGKGSDNGADNWRGFLKLGYNFY